MKVTPPRPLILDTGKVTSTNITERDTTYDPAAWVTSTNYNEGDKVYVATTSKIYQSIYEGTFLSTVSPHLDVDTLTPKWAEISYCNRWKMFDYTRNTPSYRSSPIAVTIVPAKSVNTVALLGMTGVTQVIITATVGGSSVYNTTYAPGGDIANYIIYDMSPSVSVVINITLSGSGVVGCTWCLVGASEYLGDLQSDVTRSDINFSTIDRDTYGTATIVKRRNVPKTNYSLIVLAAEISRILRVRDELNATVALWNAMHDNAIPSYYNSLISLGFYRDFSITLDNPITSTITLEVEEL